MSVSFSIPVLMFFCIGDRILIFGTVCVIWKQILDILNGFFYYLMLLKIMAYFSLDKHFFNRLFLYFPFDLYKLFFFLKRVKQDMKIYCCLLCVTMRQTVFWRCLEKYLIKNILSLICFPGNGPLVTSNITGFVIWLEKCVLANQSQSTIA
jgi:hypothetical protein